MKCIKSKSGNIRRVSDDEAQELVSGIKFSHGKRILHPEYKKDEWDYCPKTDWKGKGKKVEPNVANVVDSVEATPAPVKAKKYKKGNKGKAERAERAENPA